MTKLSRNKGLLALAAWGALSGASACADAELDDFETKEGETGDGVIGDGDGDPGDGDGDPGDGDGDPGDGDGDPGDGDGDPGDGDGDPGHPHECSVPDPGWLAPALEGLPAPHFEGLNQLGEFVGICKYEGVPIMIDTSAVWCEPCQKISRCLGDDDAACIDVFGDNNDPSLFTDLISPLRAAIHNAEIGWVTVLVEDEFGDPPTAIDAINWDMNYPVEDVWVIPDVADRYYDHLGIEAYPSIWIIDEQMNWQHLDQSGIWSTIIDIL